MRSSASSMALALASFSAMACAEPTATGSGPVSSSPEAQPLFSSAPSASGPIVGRGSSGFFYFVFDAQHSLFAIHIARDGFGFCGEPFTLIHLGDIQAIQSPAGSELIQLLFKNQAAFATIYAWHGEDILATDEALCDFLLTTPQLAHGTAHLVNTDNDLTSDVSDATRANAFGFTADGTVDLTAGGRAHYHAQSRGSLSPLGELRGTDVINLVPLQ